MSSKKNVEKKEIYGIKLRSRTVSKSVIISDTESEDEASTKIKLNSASKIVPDSSDEELDCIINEKATLNATYSKERNERPYVDNNMNLENNFFEIEGKNDTSSFHESNLHDQIQNDFNDDLTLSDSEDDLYYDEDDYDENDLDVANNLNVIAESNFNDNNVNRKKLIITKTNKGNPKLCWILLHSRKSFKRKSVKVSWKCERATTTKKNVKCLGRVSTIGECEPVNDITEHNNIPDPIREEFLSVVNENKRLALETNDNPRTIIKNSQTSLSNEASANIVRHYNLRQTIHRIRNKKRVMVSIQKQERK
jgi:hypothetical protein